jgi:hypothetical protein
MRILRPKKNEKTAECKNLHNEESQTKFWYLNYTSMKEWMGNVEGIESGGGGETRSKM